MQYQRKTYDVWILQKNYGEGEGWEDMAEYTNVAEALEAKNHSLKSQPGIPVRVRKFRIPKEI